MQVAASDKEEEHVEFYKEVYVCDFAQAPRKNRSLHCE